jgi:hypothetical protein
LERIGNGGANLLPIPRALNRHLGRSDAATGAFAGLIAAEPLRLWYNSYKILANE